MGATELAPAFPPQEESEGLAAVETPDDYVFEFDSDRTPRERCMTV